MCLCQTCENIEPKRRDACDGEKEARGIELSITYWIPECLDYVKIFLQNLILYYYTRFILLTAYFH